MASSPLEIYEQAYRFQYEENNISKACDVYRQLIQEFPDSNESGYAAIQLQKIHAQDVSRNLGKNKNMLGVVSLIVAIISLLGTGALAVFTVTNQQRAAAEAGSTAALIQAVGLMHAGRDQDALQILQEEKSVRAKDFTPYALTADIYIRQKKFDSARVEFETYQKRYGISGRELSEEPVTAKPELDADIGDSIDADDTSTAKKKTPPGVKLSDKTSVLNYLDSISNTQ